MKDDEIKILQAVGNGIKKLRIDNGYTSYEQFALQHGLDRKQYWRAENGSNITLRSLARILSYHQVTLIRFFMEYVSIEEQGT